MKRFLVKTVGLFGAALALAGPAQSQQRMSISPGVLSADHDLLGGVMYGGGLAVDVALLDSVVDFRIGASYFSGSNRRLGSTCSGLIPPGQDCSPKPLRDEFSFASAEAGLSITVLRVQQFAFSIQGNGHVGLASTQARSSTSSLAGERGLLGVSGGVGTSWTPNLHSPITVEVRALHGYLDKIGGNHIVDGYTPFEGKAFSITRFTLGVSYKLSAKKR